MGVRPGKGREYAIEVKIGAGRGAGAKSTVSLDWGKKELVGGWTHPKCTEILEVD